MTWLLTSADAPPLGGPPAPPISSSPRAPPSPAPPGPPHLQLHPARKSHVTVRSGSRLVAGWGASGGERSVLPRHGLNPGPLVSSSPPCTPPIHYPGTRTVDYTRAGYLYGGWGVEAENPPFLCQHRFPRLQNLNGCFEPYISCEEGPQPTYEASRGGALVQGPLMKQVAGSQKQAFNAHAYQDTTPRQRGGRSVHKIHRIHGALWVAARRLVSGLLQQGILVRKAGKKFFESLAAEQQGGQGETTL